MPASQLKRLKASLREQGITGPQKSKKQKGAQKSRPTSEKIERSAALQRIRDSFNPFEVRHAARPAKFESVSAKGAANGTGRYKEALHRPGVTRSAGEEMRRATLLPEMQRRNKTGGLTDRRIGEGDADMTPEEKAVQRFARAQQKKKGGASLFDLEASDDETTGFGLTHGGRSIGDLVADDFNDAMSDASDELLSKKRRRPSEEEEAQEDSEDKPEVKRSRKEIMEEVIAKSKMHKYERQKVKEDDEDLREELDKDLPDILALLHGKPAPVKPVAEPISNGPMMNPDRQRLLEGADPKKMDKEYETRLRQLAQDTRAKPSERSKTDEEKAAADAERLKDLEAKRQKRMRGEEVSDDEKDVKTAEVEPAVNGDDEIYDEAAAFGLGGGHKKKEQPVHDDEDEFALDEDLIADDSDVDISGEDDSDSDIDSEQEPDFQEEEDEFVTGVLGPTGSNTTELGQPTSKTQAAYTYPCPTTHAELLAILEPLPETDLPVVVQRIRALYHPSLSANNKQATAGFAAVLVEHLAYIGREKKSLRVAEQLMRHLHSLSRTYPLEIGAAFRKQLSIMQKRVELDAGDLIIFSAIGSIYPTSDHFHQVVTPAITLIARYLELTPPTTIAAQTTGAFLVKLVLSYQKLSKRYVPEAVRFTYNALAVKNIPEAARKAHLSNLLAMAELWREKSAFVLIFEPFVALLTKLKAKKELQTLNILLQAGTLRLRPLQLHNHKKLAIRSSVPKFEEGFDPNKHYDPDKERSDAKKLQKEYKRERKGALRELRKDANFMAREQLREKKERDAAYDKKYKRLIAEIQGQEGHEAKEYEREKKARARANKR